MYTSFFFFKQKTSYEMRISDWSSDVWLFRSAEVLAEEVADAARLVGNDRKGRIVAHAADRFLGVFHHGAEDQFHILQRAPGRDLAAHKLGPLEPLEIGRAACRERVCQSV